ncbi:MAG TPA: RNA polymerase sigma factor [Pyrinomonadaceae bacterium]|jgi:RNA polymerase sigma-70 factor (ECF subfamily)
MSEDILRLKSAIEDFSIGKNREASFQRIFNHFYPLVLNFLYKKIFDAERAKELTQETFLRVYRNISAARLEHADSFGAWLFAIARNLLMDEFRRHNRGREVSLDSEIDAADSKTKAIDLPDTAAASDVEGQAIRNEFREKLVEGIRKLPPMQQKCLMLSVYQEKTTSEIALLLKLKEGTVKAHLHQAKENLKKILAAESTN